MPNRMLDENKNLVESSGRLLDENKNLVQVHGYAIDENKNLIESDGVVITAVLTSTPITKILNALFRNETNKRLDAEDFVPLVFYSLVQCDPSSYVSFRVRQIFKNTQSVRYLVYVLNDTNTKRIKAYEYTLNTSGTGQVSAKYVGEWEQGIRLMYPVISETDGLVSITPSSLYPDEAPDKILYRLTDTEDWIEYTAPFTVEESCRIDTYVEKEGYQKSITVSAQIEIFVAPTEWVAISDMKLGTNDIDDICYGNGKFVATAGYVGSSGQGSYSTDGINWTAISDMKLNTYSPTCICYGDGKFVVGSTINAGAYSTDGITWTRISNMGFGSYGNPSSICYGDGKFVAVGGRTISYSNDGITWTNVNFDPLSAIRDVCYGDGKFVAVTGGVKDEEIIYSTDGINWNTVVDAGFGSWAISSVCYGDGKFVAVSGNSNRASYSTDGITWTSIADMKVETPETVGYGNGKFVMVGYDGQASYSTDGITWVSIPDMKVGTDSLESDIISICYGNDKFVVGTYKGKGSYCIC